MEEGGGGGVEDESAAVEVDEEWEFCVWIDLFWFEETERGFRRGVERNVFGFGDWVFGCGSGRDLRVSG